MVYPASRVGLQQSPSTFPTFYISISHSCKPTHSCKPAFFTSFEPSSPETWTGFPDFPGQCSLTGLTGLLYSKFHIGRHFFLHEHYVKVCERDVSMVTATLLIG